ncbi:copper resistance CopC family protein [Metaplanococcus flavidus]|uniref:Copper resistance protein CopC n=1 Tax=Metaplanococcus flavidus TaxID=569883 RepID=A0ABW3LDB4_9BACL
MKKLMIIALLLMFLPSTAHAHSGLSSSTPAEGESLDQAPAEILFQFDTPIQQGEMNITEASGNAFEFTGVSVSDTELRGELSEGLPNGAYTVSWSVISQDSHEVTGTLTFSVAAESIAEEPVEEEVAEEATEEEATTEEATSEEAEAASAPDVEPAKADTPWVTILIVALLIIAAVTFFVLARRK